MSVKRINAFRIGDPGRGVVLFDPYKPMRHCRSHCHLDYRWPSLKEPASTFRGQIEIVPADPATIQEQHATDPDPQLVFELRITHPLVNWILRFLLEQYWRSVSPHHRQ